MKIFVLLPAHLDVDEWADRHWRHLVPDRTPYGYHHAEAGGHTVVFSKATRPTGPISLLQRGLRRVLGFDFAHALANLNAMRPDAADVVWTHTEREHLAIEFLRWISGGWLGRTPIIAQSVWLMDEWERMSPIRRAFFRLLLKRANVLTFLSPENAGKARDLRLNARIDFVPFGISLDSFPIRRPEATSPSGRPIRIFALGNDRHRDWETFAAAFGGRDDFEVAVASTTYPVTLTAVNFEVGPRDQAGISAGYEWADVVVVPLVDNLHASGVTVLLEAVASGVPVVASDTGGLRSYFDASLVDYVAVGDAEGMRHAVLAVFAEETAERSTAAQAHLLNERMTTEGYTERYVQLSEDFSVN